MECSKVSKRIQSLSCIFVVLATITLLSVSGVSASHLGDDLVLNSDFEVWNAGKPVNWTTPNNDWKIVQVNSTSGNNSLMLKTNRYTSPTSGTMISESVEVDEGDLFFVTTRVRSTNAIDTKVMLRGYDNDRKRWVTLKTFKPSSDMQHIFITVPEDTTQLRMRLDAGYVDDKKIGSAWSYFDDLCIIKPSVENADFYLEDGVISNSKSLKIGSFELDLDDIGTKNDMALINIVASGEVIDSGILIPGEVVEFKKENDQYLIFLVDEVFVNAKKDYSEVRINHLLAGRIITEASDVAIQPVDEDGLILYLSFDENTGIDVYDYSGENNHGSIYGPKWTGGMENSALEFDGLTDYVGIPDTSGKFEEGDHTFTLWVKSTGERDATKYIFGHYNWRFGWSSDSKLSFSVGRMNDKNGPAYSVSADVSEHKNDWIHLAGVYKPSENKIIFYVNGVYAGEKDIGEDRIWADYGNHDLLIGTSKHGASTFFEGLVEEVRIYDRALSQQEIGGIVSKSIGLSGISSYHNSISLEKDTAVSVGNGFGLKFSGAPRLDLVLIEGVTQTNTYSLVNASAGQTLLLKNAKDTPVIRLNIGSITSEKLILSDIWVADEKADTPILEIKSIDFSEIRVYEPATVNVTIVNNGSKTYRSGGEDSIDLYLKDDKVGSYKISNDLAPGDTLEYSFEVDSQKAGESQIMAVISTDYITNTLSSTAKIEPPINPPVTRMPLYIEETESGIILHLTLHGYGIKGESWNDDAQITMGISNPFGSKTFYENSHKVSGTGSTIKIPYEEFYEGDEQYLITVKFRDAENSVIAKISGEDGTYDSPNNRLLSMLLFVPLLMYVVRKKLL